MSYEKLPHAFDQRLRLGGTFRVPLHSDVTRKGKGVEVTYAFDESVWRFCPGFKCRGKTVDALVVM